MFLLKLSFIGILKLLRGWSPPNNSFTYSRDDLRETLTETDFFYDNVLTLRQPMTQMESSPRIFCYPILVLDVKRK